MKHKITYWKIFNYRLKELTGSVNTKNANAGGGARAFLILIPLLFVTVSFELIWVRLFGGDLSKYT